MVITGVIRPPPEIRAVADRTAAYVAKNGRAFETRILSSAKGKTPKFAFLQQTSPFHGYYEDRIQFYQNGGEDEVEDAEKRGDGDGKKEKEAKTAPSAKKIGAPAVRKKDKKQKASAMDPIAKALLDQRAKIAAVKAAMEKELQRQKEGGEGKEAEDDDGEPSKPRASSPAAVMPLQPPPPLDLVTIVAPSNLSPTQIETIQLVAQFTAMDGKGGPFLHQLTLREWSNPEFGFVQPRHGHFAYFSALVDAYRKIIHDWTLPEALSKDDKKKTSSPLATRQTVLQEVAYRVEYERELEENHPEEGEVVPIDWHDFVVVETIDFPADEKVEAILPPPPPAQLAAFLPSGVAAAAPKTASAAGGAGNEMDESDDEDDDQGETIRVVPSYTPKVVSASSFSQARAIDPITGKSVAVADMPEHMRIQLLDPKWAEERKKFQDKQKDSNLVGDEAIVNNINRLSRARAEDQDGRSGLSGQEEANRILREQGRGPGPSLPPPPPRPAVPGVAAAASSGQPDAKRQKLDPGLAPPPQQQQQFKVTRAPPIVPLPSSGGQDGYQPHLTSPNANPMESSTIASNEPTMEFDFGAAVDSAPTQEDRTILPEQEFVASLDKPEVTLNIRVPNDPTQMAWNFYGQIVTVTVNVMAKVKDVKADLSKLHLNEMPPNKIEIRDTQGSGFLKNNQTLAALNIFSGATLEMKAKQRGGRKG